MNNQPDGLWESTKELNNAAAKPYLHGFSVPSEVEDSLATERALYDSIYNEYKLILKNGVKDPDEYWDELKDRVADIQKKAIEAYQPLFDEWLASKQ